MEGAQKEKKLTKEREQREYLQRLTKLNEGFYHGWR